MCHEKLPSCPRVFKLVARDARRKYVVYGDYRIDFGSVGVIFTVFNLYVAARNRRLDEQDKQDQRAAEQSYKYSKEVQVEPVVLHQEVIGAHC